jgi:hypothetical protein
VAGTWQEVLLAAGTVAADGTVGVRIDSTSSDGADYHSKEGGAAVAPQLVLTVSGWPALNWYALR